MTDVVRLLERQHDEALALLREVAQTEGGAAVAELWRLGRTVLARHLVLAEALLHPALAVDPRSAEVLLDPAADHAGLADLIAELDLEPPLGDGWLARLAELQAHVLRHVEEEEREVFPILRAWSPAAREQVGGHMQQLDRSLAQVAVPTPATVAAEAQALVESRARRGVSGRVRKPVAA